MALVIQNMRGIAAFSLSFQDSARRSIMRSAPSVSDLGYSRSGTSEQMHSDPPWMDRPVDRVGYTWDGSSSSVIHEVPVAKKVQVVE